LKIDRRRANFIGTKNCGGEKRSGESEGGQKFLPPNPPSFLPARAFSLAREARRQFRSKKVRIWSNKRTIAGQFSQVREQVASIASGFERPAKIALILF